MKFYKSLFFICLLSISVKAQIYFRPFAEIKLLGNLNIKKEGNLSNVRLLASIGSKGNLNHYSGNQRVSYFITPIATAAIMLGKGIGASMLDKRLGLRLQFNVNLNLTGEWGPYQIVSLQHRIEGAPYMIENGFKADRTNVINISSSEILVNIDKKNYDLQRVGGVFVGINRFSFSYFNDGPPFGMWAGDGLDRWFTGTGHASYNFSGLNEDINKGENIEQKNARKEIRLSFARYTGYEKNSYEYGTAILNDYVMYKDESYQAFNRGLFGLHFYSDNFFGGVILNDNDMLDIQNLIHRVRLMAFHRSVNRSSVSFEGGSYFNLNN
jgi:hypothetical protein